MSEQLHKIEGIIKRIRKFIPDGPEEQELLDQRFAALGELVEAYLNATTEDRQTIYRMSKKCLTELWVYSMDRAAWGVETEDLEVVFKGFVALGIENLRIDDRDAIRALSTLFHSVRKLNGSDEEMVARVLPVVPEEIGALIQSFQSRPPHLKSIEIMGYKEGQVAGQFYYLPVDDC